jgi:iron complex outermembrane receptor protein
MHVPIPVSISKIAFSFTLAFLLSQYSFAQYTIKGNVSDSTNASVPFVAVGLLSAKDSSVIKGTITSDSGSYSFTKVKQGRYIIKVQAMGYADQYSKPFTADSSNAIQVIRLRLRNNGMNLKGVNVVANKPFMEHKQDRMVFNLENSIISTGKNALEVLNDLPGVTTTDDGSINVLGRSGVLVMVDGRPLHIDLTTFLKSIDASQIEKIEVITNPSAKYEASGKAVINIVLIKNKNMGLNGQLSSGYRQGTHASFSDALNIDYRIKKWNLFFDLNDNIFHNYGTHTITRTFSANNIVQQTFIEDAPATYQGNLPSGDMGFDFTPNSKQTISFSTNGVYMINKISTYDNTKMYGTAGELDSSIYAPSVRNLTTWDVNFNLAYTYKIDTNGRELSANAFYVTHGGADNQQNPVSYFNSDGSAMRASTLNNSIQPTALQFSSAQVDYIQPLSKKSKIEMGVLASKFHEDNNAQFFNDINGIAIVDTTKTNRFVGTENILAAYLNYSQKISAKTDFQIGVRDEQTNDIAEQYVHDTSFTRNYLNLFPSATFNWNPSANSAISLSYTRRIDRPDPGDINPFINQIDPYTYTRGNIALLPTLSDNYQVSYSFMQAVSVILSHSYMTNVESLVYHQNDSTHITYAEQENLSTYSEYSLMLIVDGPIAPWWNTTTSINGFNDKFYGALAGTNFNRAQNSYQFKTLNTFNLKKGWLAEMTFWYNSTIIDGLSTNHAVYDFEAGVGKRFDKQKLNIKLNFTDIFMTQQFFSSQVYQNVNIEDKNYGDLRKVRLVVSWKFGQSEYEREQRELKTLNGGKESRH